MSLNENYYYVLLMTYLIACKRFYRRQWTKSVGGNSGSNPKPKQVYPFGDYRRREPEDSPTENN